MQKILRNPIGVWFSELKDNWEEVDFINHDFYKELPFRDRYRYYGNFPDGSQYGAWYSPKHEPWPANIDIQIVDEKGEFKSGTCAEGCSYSWRDLHWPTAIVASPSGRCLVWLIEGKLWEWHMEKEGLFLSEGEECLTKVLGERRAQDAVMHPDGILEIKFVFGENIGYFCDARAVLDKTENGWESLEEESYKFSPKYRDFDPSVTPIPSSLVVTISDEQYWGDLSGSGISRVRFASGLKKIEGELLSDNPELDYVVIPPHIEYVDWWAFARCSGLKHLVIEGDLSRVANWDKDAFEGCPCEDYYLMIRNGNASSD